MGSILLAKRPAGWGRNTAYILSLILLLTIAAFQASNVFAAMAPANAVIGNQASATYVDNTATTRTSTSNTVQTTVAQVKSFTLTQSGSKTVPANQQVCYPHTITNTGNGQDTYTLNAPTTGGMFAHTALAYYLDADQNGQPDNGSAITTSGPLTAGASFNYVVCGTTPSTATPGQNGTITVSATDTNSPTANTASQTDTTTIGNASVTVLKKLSSVAPPGYTPVSSGTSPNAGPLYVVLEYTNAGTIAADSLVLTDALPSGWLYVPGSGRWSGSGMTALTDAAGGDPSGITYSAPATAISGTIAATVTNVPGSTSGNLYFQITIAPNLAVTTPLNQSVTTNTATYRYSYQFGGNTICVNGSSTTTIMMPNAGASCPTTTPASTNSVLYSVLQFADVAANGSSTTYGTTDGEPVTISSAAPGQTITFTNYIWNRGNSADGFDITLNTPLDGSACNPANNAATGQCTFPVGTTFQILSANGMTSLLNSGGTGDPDTGTIPLPDAMGNCPAPYFASTSMPKKCGYAVVVTAIIPAGASPGNNGGNGYQFLLRAQSFFNTSVFDTVPNRLNSLTANSVDLTNNLSVTGGATATTSDNTGEGLGSSGNFIVKTNSVIPQTSATTTTRFQLYVNNTGSTSTIYDLTSTFISVPSGLSNPPAGWTVTFKDDGGSGNCSSTTGGALTSTGATPIAAGSAKLICAEVVVPSTSSGTASVPTYAASGNYVIEFRASQQGNATVFDTKRDQVTVQPTHSVAITPNGAQSTVPGGAVTYSHTITNNGNVTETVNFGSSCLTNSQTPTYSWSSTAYIDTFPAGTPNGSLDVGSDTLITCGMTSIMLTPNQSMTLFVRVNAPAAAGSPPNVTSITATYNSGANTASASDTTTLTDGLKLDKYQQLPGGTGSCSVTPSTTLTGNTPNAPWSNMAIAAGPNTVPGKCVAYLVVGTNTTASNITNLNISDVVPANTKLETGCGAPSATGPVAISGSYSSGFTGTISAQSSPSASTPLAPGASFTFQFCVKINDM